MCFSTPLWGRVLICWLDVTQHLILPVGETAEEESTAYYNNSAGPTKAVCPAEHIKSPHRDVFCELHWIDDQAYDLEYRNDKEQATDSSHKVETKYINGERNNC